VKRIVLALVVSFLSACGGDDEGGPKTYSGECVYISTQHAFYDAAQCTGQSETLACKSAVIDDRSEADRDVFACVYEGCSDEFDCDAFRSF
jgi:hypothetical protein